MRRGVRREPQMQPLWQDAGKAQGFHSYLHHQRLVVGVRFDRLDDLGGGEAMKNALIILTIPIWLPLGLIPVVLALLFLGTCWLAKHCFYRPLGIPLPYPIWIEEKP